jgi:glycosyltransferase involved in cell wall biosynthesis
MTFVTSQMEEDALAMCDRVFVENNRMQRHVASLISPEKVVYAPPGVDTDYFRPAAYRPDGPILSVGRFADQRKNVLLLLNAYSRLVEKMPGAPGLVLAGSPPDEQTMATMRGTRLEGRVAICTRVSQERLLELYQGASCYVLSSNEEGFGLALVEAMACGIPVVSTRCGGPEQTVLHRENGLLVPIRDADAMAEALLSLLQNRSERERMGANGRLWVESRFSYRCAAVPYLSQYEEILNRRRHTAGALRSSRVIKC